MALSDWSATAANNDLTLGVNIAEGCPPSVINNAIRKAMADVATGINVSLLGTFLASTTLSQARDALGVSGGTTSANNFYGLANTAGKIPTMNGSDTWTTSDISQFVPAGAVFAFARNTPPTGYLECDGSAVSRTTYAALFAIISTTFGVGDGSTTFNVPDLRGEFIRGWDNGRGVDAARSFGSAQSEAVGPHDHSLEVSSFNQIAHDSSAEGDLTVSASGTPTAGIVSTSTGTENRPRNIALLHCIKT